MYQGTSSATTTATTTESSTATTSLTSTATTTATTRIYGRFECGEADIIQVVETHHCPAQRQAIVNILQNCINESLSRQEVRCNSKHGFLKITTESAVSALNKALRAYSQHSADVPHGNGNRNGMRYVLDIIFVNISLCYVLGMFCVYSFFFQELTNIVSSSLYIMYVDACKLMIWPWAFLFW